MTSSRLPGKIMKEVLGKPLLGYLVERLRCCNRIKNIILATTANPKDNPVATLAQALGLKVFRGSENNVLDRFYRAATIFGSKHIMRVTADCPLIDPDLLDILAEYYFSNKFDYASNNNPPTLPDGLDAEIFTFEALEYSHIHAELPSDLEHVTPYIRNHPALFRIGNWLYHKDLSYLRWTVDESEDFEFVRQIIEFIYPDNKNFRTEDIVGLLHRRPELLEINARFARNEGYLASLEEDKKFLDSGNYINTQRHYNSHKREIG